MGGMVEEMMYEFSLQPDVGQFPARTRISLTMGAMDFFVPRTDREKRLHSATGGEFGGRSACPFGPLGHSSCLPSRSAGPLTSE